MAKPAIIAKITAAEGKRDDALAAIAEVAIPNAEGEPGTEVYVAHADSGDDVTIWFYELYTDQDAVAAHGASDGMKQVGAALAPFLAGPPELHFLTTASGKGLEL